jgi:hypothetical protein
MQVNVLYYSQSWKQKRKRSPVSLAEGVKPPVTGDQPEKKRSEHMKHTHQRRSDCPINFALETFGDPWSLLLIRDIVYF